jgi:hypothetical protein
LESCLPLAEADHDACHVASAAAARLRRGRPGLERVTAGRATDPVLRDEGAGAAEDADAAAGLKRVELPCSRLRASLLGKQFQPDERSILGGKTVAVVKRITENLRHDP